MSSVLVTGAGGFIGRSVVARAEQAGFDVISVGRRPLPGRSVVLDLTQPLSSLPAVDVIFHLAGHYAGADRDAFEQTDLAIARNLVDWGETTGVRCWVFASAAEVYGPCKEPASEEAPVNPRIPYGRAKLVIEGWLADLAGRVPRSRVVALRIGEVYGRNGKLIEELTARMRKGFCPWFGDARVPVSFVHVEDVARSFCAAAHLRAPGYTVVNVADDQPVFWRAFLERVAEGLGARAPVHLPLALGSLYSALSTTHDRMRRKAPIVTRHLIELLTTAKPMSNARLRTKLGLDLLYPDYRSGLDEVFATSEAA
jgi:nucleoside-diphosphate-sugar epimerase